MIRMLLRQDQGTDNLMMPVIISVGVGLFLRAMERAEGYAPLFSPENTGGIWLIHNFVVWSVLLAGLVGSRYWLRATRLQIALPLRARTLWLIRMGAITLGCMVIVVVIALVNSIRPGSDGGLSVNGMVWSGSLRIAAVFILLLTILQAPAPHLRRLRTSGWYIAYTIVMWLLGVLLLALAPRSAWSAVPILIVAALIGWRTWRRIPRAFQLELEEPEQGDVDDPPAPGPTESVTPAPVPSARTTYLRNGVSRVLLHRTLWRMMHNHWLGWLFTALMGLYGFLFIHIFQEGRSGLIFMFYLFIFGFAAGNQALLRLHAVDAWPLSRRMLFAHSVWPMILTFAVGLGLGIAGNEIRTKPAKMIRAYDSRVAIPYEFHQVAPDGQPPEVTSPWGETFTPTGIRILPWGDAVIYNPYEIGHDTSSRLDALQIDRAVAAVLGDPPPDPARYAELEADVASEPAEWRHHGFDLENSRGRGSELRSKTYALLSLAFCLVSLPLMLVGTLSYDTRALDWIRGKAAVAAIVLPIGVIALMLISEVFTGTKMWAQGAALLIGLRKLAEALPFSEGTLWLAALLVAICSYVIMQERYVRLEASQVLIKKRQQDDY